MKFKQAGKWRKGEKEREEKRNENLESERRHSWWWWSFKNEKCPAPSFPALFFLSVSFSLSGAFCVRYTSKKGREYKLSVANNLGSGKSVSGFSPSSKVGPKTI